MTEPRGPHPAWLTALVLVGYAFVAGSIMYTVTGLVSGLVSP